MTDARVRAAGAARAAALVGGGSALVSAGLAALVEQ
jgi:hypothetical protein